MQEIKIKCKGADSLSIDTIKDFQGKLKHITRDNLDRLKVSILKNGFVAPIFVWRNEGQSMALDGHQRIKALLSMRDEGYNIPLLPVAYIEADNEDDARQKLLAITSQYGEFDIDELNSWVSNLDADIAETLRFVDDKIELDIEEIETEGDDEIEDEIEPITRLGDIWGLGDHRVMCGDSTDHIQLETLMMKDDPDIVFTDPPYGIDIINNSPRLQENKKLGSIGGSVKATVGKYKSVKNDDSTEAARKVIEYFSKNQLNMIVWGGNYFTDFLPPSRGWIVWDKRNGDTTFADCEIAYTTQQKSIRIYDYLWSGMRREGRREDEGQYRFHPTQKPVGLIVNIFSDWAKGCIKIIDPFLGSGSTLIACEKTNRICYGMELDPHYCDVIVKRYTDWCIKNEREYIIKLNGEAWQ